MADVKSLLLPNGPQDLSQELVIRRCLEQWRTSGGNAPSGRREQPPLQPCRKHTFVAQGVQKTSVYCTAPAARDDRLSKYSSSAGPPLLQRVVAGWLVSARRPEAINDVLRLKEPFRRHSSAKVTREITRDDAIAK